MLIPRDPRHYCAISGLEPCAGGGVWVPEDVGGQSGAKDSNSVKIVLYVVAVAGLSLLGRKEHAKSSIT